MTNKCKHEHWEIFSMTSLGNGQCIDCNEEVSLVTLFNGLKNRMEAAMKNMEWRMQQIASQKVSEATVGAGSRGGR